MIGTLYKITKHVEMARQHVQKAVEDTGNRNRLTGDPEMRVVGLAKNYDYHVQGGRSH